MLVTSSIGRLKHIVPELLLIAANLGQLEFTTVSFSFFLFNDSRKIDEDLTIEPGRRQIDQSR